MLIFSLLLAPLVMAAAAVVERRLGPSAAGWVAALPVAFTVAMIAVSIDAGPATGRALALSAATHVCAQVMFAVAFATVLRRVGLIVGIASGSAAYAACSVLIGVVPAWASVAGGILALLVGPRLLPHLALTARAPGRSWPATALTCVAAPLIVAAAVLSARAAGPQVAGTVAAFPTMCLTLTVAVVLRAGRDPGVLALTGLVRSLPCYLTFCLVAVLAQPVSTIAAVPLALAAALAAGYITWRAIPVRTQPQIITP